MQEENEELIGKVAEGEIKTERKDEEIELLKEAINITYKGFLRALKFVKPGIMEYEVEAEIIHEFDGSVQDEIV